jgi:hypothetical protein
MRRFIPDEYSDREKSVTAELMELAGNSLVFYGTVDIHCNPLNAPCNPISQAFMSFKAFFERALLAPLHLFG